MPAIDNAEPLPPEQATRLTDFARACKAAARVVALYPTTHPVIRSALDRVADAGQRLRAGANATITALPDGLLLDGRPLSKPDAALTDLGSLLHSHQVGELSLLGDLDTAAWHSFLSLLARAPEDVRAEGGIGRAWMAAGGGPIELRQIDYREVLREREAGLHAEWDRLIANYLEGELSDLDDEAMSALFDIAADQHRFKEFAERLVTQAAEGGRRGKRDVVVRVLQALADFVARNHPEQLDRILHQIAGVVPRLTPDLVVSLITGAMIERGEAPTGIDFAGEVRARLTDRTITEFVAQSVSRDCGASERLAQAFQLLVPEGERRDEMLELVRDELGMMPIGRQPDFADLWQRASDLLKNYSDSSYVSDNYSNELSSVRGHAIEVERVSDDPADRIGSWLSTVSETEVRRLDQCMLIELLQIETRRDAWTKMLDTTLASIDRLVLTGNIAFAQELLDAIVAAAADGHSFCDIASEGLEHLRNGPLVRHVVLFVRQARDEETAQISRFCRTLGPSVIGPLAEALAIEQGSMTVKRLREVLLSFGAAGRAYADELRTSANPAVRRTAIELLRAFGGADALPDLASLLDDAEPGVQREALRAIVHIGTNEAYATLEQALKSGTSRTQQAIMQVLVSARDERAAPLFIYILDHSDYWESFENVYLTAIEALGKLGGDRDSVAALKRALYRGSWWAPLRTKRHRAIAARALSACGSEAAVDTLEEAVQEGPRGVRRAVRAALAAAPEPSARRVS